LVESNTTIECLQDENEALKYQEAQFLQASKSSRSHVASLDINEGLSKLMGYLSVKGIGLDTLANKRKHNDAKIT
jgi:hypothetical protein